jgi:hypothetical protein
MKYLLILTMLIAGQVFSQQLAKFKVEIEEDRMDSPVSVSLNGINYNTDDGKLVLYELTKSGEKRLESQIEPGHSARLWFLLPGISEKGTSREFVLKREQADEQNSPVVSVQKDSKDFRLAVGNKSILSYRHAVTPAPEGADPLYRRSGYIHPLTSPGGEVLTCIQPEDHYHHYGLWGPWTKTNIEGRSVDFWNLKEGQGTVKFAGFLSEMEGAVYSGFRALQQHIDFGAKGPDQIAINEILEVRAWNVGEKVWIVDYTTSINSPLQNGILLDAYRYGGGIGFRATKKWQKDNCTVLTSDKKTRVDADGSFARWCIVEGESDTPEGRSGILFLSHPSNRKHPEPMRIWPENAQPEGYMYFEFVPIRHEEWRLEPKKDYTLKYRMVVFDGKIDAETAEMYWNSFSKNPKIQFMSQ